MRTFFRAAVPAGAGAVVVGLAFLALTHASVIGDWLQQSPRHTYYVAGGIVVLTFAGIYFRHAVGQLPGTAIATAGGLTAVLTLVFLTSPNLAPSVQRSFVFTSVGIERNVRLAEYARDLPVERAFPKLGDAVAKAAAGRRTGTVVDFTTQASGLRKQEIDLNWTLLNSRSRVRVGRAETRDPLCTLITDHGRPCVAYVANRKELDTSTFEFWVDTSNTRARCYVVRLEAYTEDIRIAFRDSPHFPRPTAPSAKC